MPTWTGTWDGGRTATSRGKTVWYIERSFGSGKARKRVVKCLGPIGEARAKAELALFLQDPFSYRTPTERGLASHEARESAKKAEADGAVVLTLDLIGKFREVQLAGYEGTKPVSQHHAFVTHAYLSKWATGPLYGKDLRKVTTPELRDMLPAKSKAHWVKAIKSLTAWLRWGGKLKAAEDPTLELRVPQARKAGAAEKASRIPPVKALEATYAAIPNATVRSIWAVRLLTGMHVSEIKRVAAGKATIEKVKGQGKIAAVIDFPHKSGEHRQSVSEEVLAHIERLQKAEGFPTEKTFARNRKKAAEASGYPEIQIGHLRHIHITLATEIGELVRPKEAKAGVPLEVVARAVGHRNTSTTLDHYLGQRIPPLVHLPVKLVHPEDPPVSRMGRSRPKSR